MGVRRMNNMKYFILDYARAGWGKTSVLNLVIQKLGTPHIMVNGGKDQWAQFNNVTTTTGQKCVVVSTVGDPQSTLPQWLRDAVNANADIIVCAARQRGTTVANVKKILGGAGYQGIWFRNFNSNQSACVAAMNNATADAIVQLIHNL